MHFAETSSRMGENAAALLTQERAYASWFDDVPIFDCDDPLYTVTWYYRWYILRNTYVEPGVGAFQHGTFYEGRSHKVVKDEYAPWGHEFTQMIPLSTPMHVTDARWKADGSACQEALYTLLDSMDEDGIFRTMMLDRFSFPFGNFSEWALYGYYLLHPDRDFIRKTLPGFKKNVQGNIVNFIPTVPMICLSPITTAVQARNTNHRSGTFGAILTMPAVKRAMIGSNE